MTVTACSHPGSVMVDEYPDGSILWQCTGCDEQWIEDPST